MTGVKAGLGDPVFDRLDAQIASAMMGINAVKGVEIGDGFEMAKMRGSEARDELTPEKFTSNHSGGILGGISSGQEIIVKMALKLMPRIEQPTSLFSNTRSAPLPNGIILTPPS